MFKCDVPRNGKHCYIPPLQRVLATSGTLAQNSLNKVLGFGLLSATNFGHKTVEASSNYTQLLRLNFIFIFYTLVALTLVAANHIKMFVC